MHKDRRCVEYLGQDKFKKFRLQNRKEVRIASGDLDSLFDSSFYWEVNVGKDAQGADVVWVGRYHTTYDPFYVRVVDTRLALELKAWVNEQK